MTRRRAVRDGLIVAGVIFNLTLIFAWGPRLDLWIDAHSWQEIDLSNLYRGTATTLSGTGAFRYSPLVAWLLVPLSHLSWAALVTVWTALNLAALLVMTRRNALLLLIAFPPVLLEVLNGNIHLFMALAIWAGIRWSAAWSFILLTKVTPGVGALWFAGRREWRSLAVSLGVTGFLAALGTLLAPELWHAWLQSLLGSAGLQGASGGVSLSMRITIAATLALYAGHSGRAWLVPIASFIAMPTIWIQSTAILTACFPLWAERRRWSSEVLRESAA
ncbi:MAG: DUF2029 domain-containing protein [Chloroflexi bacterium]|nr:DUF2029 domain-containing protein [Chloroflexota bacterium]